jgi:hypothetical protein
MSILILTRPPIPAGSGSEGDYAAVGYHPKLIGFINELFSAGSEATAETGCRFLTRTYLKIPCAVSIRYKSGMIRLSDEEWERVRHHFPEEHIADGRPGRRIVDRHGLPLSVSAPAAHHSKSAWCSYASTFT